MRLQVTQSSARRALPQLTFCFTAILVPKKERKRKCGYLFRPKNKTPKNKKCVFWCRKIKRKRNSVGLYFQPHPKLPKYFNESPQLADEAGQ